jgi:hypothetical protein
MTKTESIHRKILMYSTPRFLIPNNANKNRFCSAYFHAGSSVSVIYILYIFVRASILRDFRRKRDMTLQNDTENRLERSQLPANVKFYF